MSSSTSLALVNKVLSLSGDLTPDLTAITGSTGGIAERIVEMLNLVIGDMERKFNWPFLRVNVQGPADGITGIMDFVGPQDIRSGGPVSVWIEGSTRMEEVTAEQFDLLAAEQSVTTPAVFQRGVAAGGGLEIQIHSIPAAGEIVHVSAYSRATRLSATVTDTTEFDDDVLVLGALMHLDAYDGLDRGYAGKFKEVMSDYVSEVARNSQIRVEVESYS